MCAVFKTTASKSGIVVSKLPIGLMAVVAESSALDVAASEVPPTVQAFDFPPHNRLES